MEGRLGRFINSIRKGGRKNPFAECSTDLDFISVIYSEENNPKLKREAEKVREGLPEITAKGRERMVAKLPPPDNIIQFPPKFKLSLY